MNVNEVKELVFGRESESALIRMGKYLRVSETTRGSSSLVWKGRKSTQVFGVGRNKRQIRSGGIRRIYNLNLGTYTNAKKETQLDRFSGLTWNDIEEWADGKTVARGKDYQRRGHVSGLAVTDDGQPACLGGRYGALCHQGGHR